MWDKSKLENIFSQFMKELNLDLTDASLKDTPKRVAKMFIDETCNWLFTEPPRITVFPNDWSYDQMVLVRDIQVQSLCEHHFQPFIWKAYIAYIPKDKVVWLSKFARVIDYFARRPQVQERLTMQIHNFLVDVLETEDVAVIIKAEHFCMKLRWVKDPCSDTVTSNLSWVFRDDSSQSRQEFLALLKI